jgi:acetyltransferase-like isoleucine patch superfamily enzyme
VPNALLVFWLRLIQAWDRFRLSRIASRHPGLSIAPTANSNFARAEFHLQPGARLEIGPGVTTERRTGGVRFILGEGAHVTIAENCWFWTDYSPIFIVAGRNAKLHIGPHTWLNGCHLSAKESLEVGREAMIGPGSRVFDSDQHDIDEAHLEHSVPTRIGEHCWIASDVTILKGAHIGPHCVVGARSVVTRPIPAHTLAVGSPARAVGKVGDRSTQPRV